MKIVIDISRKYYEDFKLQFPILNNKAPSEVAKYAIATGTPLPQQPCEDAISRQAVLDLMQLKMGGKELYKAVYDLPPTAPTQEWIPCSERLPEELEPVNITWINHNPESYYADIKDKPFTATGVYFNGQWYWWSTLCTDILAEYSHNYDDVIDYDIEITAWQPLPESFKVERKDLT